MDLLTDTTDLSEDPSGAPDQGKLRENIPPSDQVDCLPVSDVLYKELDLCDILFEENCNEKSGIMPVADDVHKDCAGEPSRSSLDQRPGSLQFDYWLLTPGKPLIENIFLHRMHLHFHGI
jgi:hypothetical protein